MSSIITITIDIIIVTNRWFLGKEAEMQLCTCSNYAIKRECLASSGSGNLRRSITEVMEWPNEEITKERVDEGV